MVVNINPAMKLRKRITPRRTVDFLFMAFLVFIIPTAYWFELFIVFPTFHEHLSLGHIVHVALATFMLINVTSNFYFMIMTDTSVKEAVTSDMVDHEFWMYCELCEMFIPPRSWHCTICKTCILRRDHHCWFGGCCIGHRNYRYFFLFLLGFTLSSVYMLGINTYFILQFFDFNHLLLLLSCVSPMIVLCLAGTPLNPSQLSVEHLYTLFYGLNLFGVVLSVLLLWRHSSAVLRGQIMAEVVYKVYDYDTGSVKQNVSQALGRRWHLTWISPLVHSELPSNGISWTIRGRSKKITDTAVDGNKTD